MQHFVVVLTDEEGRLELAVKLFCQNLLSSFESETWGRTDGRPTGPSMYALKVVPLLPLTEHHSMKAYWGVEVQLHSFFDLGTRRR